jgi:UDP-N-acetylglucosamine diphosphorylase/glucosamine-1-phosphate N-acetyltransferase
VKLFLDDSAVREGLYPFTATRQLADIRIGIMTIREKWGLAGGFELMDHANGDATRMDAAIVPSMGWMQRILARNAIPAPGPGDSDLFRVLEYPWQIFQFNDWAIRKDFEMICKGRSSAPVSTTNKLIGGGDIFLEEGAVVEHSMLNASSGPIYIGKDAEVQEGCMVRGPFALCAGGVLKMGSRIYGATTIGPYSIVSGEVKNSVIFGYSNKAHEGYLGDSVIGEWCNLGAGTTNSNVKNTAGEVKAWYNGSKDYKAVGLKCGLLMGDYSRSAINTSFNTGTVVGVCCNIFGAGFPPKFVHDFTWGLERYRFDKALTDIANWKKLKGHDLTNEEKKRLHQLYTQS